ncbi:MAG TPA: alpha/beta hydrolase-fold protein [Ornithinibacter sp.]|nr:alpha/beta hydrolase-fold protein [Ornithinibacter sp.]
MSLTGTGLLWALGILAVALFAAIVYGWPHRGPTTLRLAGRAVPVLVLNGVVVLICLAVLNDQYLFYTSWSDLLGARQTQAVAHHGGTTAAAFAASAKGPGLAGLGGVRDYALPQPGQRLQHYTVVDPASGAALPVLVHLPAGYDPTGGRTYPVIMGMHTWPGVAQSFTRAPFLATIDALTATHRLAPSIVVIPQINDPRTIDTECVNGPPGDPQADTWLAKVVPQWAVEHLRVQTQRTSWTTLGNSYGGWCAASVAMRHPDVFGGAVVFEGYFEPDFLAGYDPLGPAQLKGYDLVHLAAHAPPPIAMWVFASRQDSLAYPTTARFLAAARSPLSVSATIVKVGGHRTSIYSPYVRPALQWLASTLPGFRP